jgi:ribA/ribD-fused uncharacterized protein
MDEATQNKLYQFYKKRAKFPTLYTYTNDGNLVIKNAKTEEIYETINLPNYRPPSFEEIEAMEQSRLEKIAEHEQKFEEERTKLYDMQHNSESGQTYSKAEILRQNKKVLEAEQLLLQVSYPDSFPNRKIYNRYITYNIIPNPYSYASYEIRQVLFNEPYDERKIEHPMYFLREMPFNIQNMYARQMTAEEAEIYRNVLSEQAAGVAEQEKQISAVFFYKSDSNSVGFFSADWATEIDFKGVHYNSVTQGVSVELAKFFNDNEAVKRLMSAYSALDASYKYEDANAAKNVTIPQWENKLEEVLFEVNLAKFRQYPELAQKLLETGELELVEANPTDLFTGTGLTLENPDIYFKSKWIGKNMMGIALQKVRQFLQTEKDTTDVKTVAEQPQVEEQPVLQEGEQVIQIQPQVAEEQPVAEQTVQIQQIPERLVIRKKKSVKLPAALP